MGKTDRPSLPLVALLRETARSREPSPICARAWFWRAALSLCSTLDETAARHIAALDFVASRRGRSMRESLWRAAITQFWAHCRRAAARPIAVLDTARPGDQFDLCACSNLLWERVRALVPLPDLACVNCAWSVTSGSPRPSIDFAS